MNPVKCWGCECEVPLIDGYHQEETDIPDTVYVYPCNAVDDEDVTSD